MPPVLTYVLPGVLFVGALTVFAVAAQMEAKGQPEKARVLRLAAVFDLLLALGLFVFFLMR